jgi:arylsulfatase A-like enzyme
MNQKRIVRVACTFIIAFTAGCLFAAVARAAEQPINIVYIMSDDHAAHAISCYGSVINQTPNLDRLAAAGMRFDRCYVTNALCGPSRATLLTSKYSHLNGFRDNKQGTKFDGSQQTFPKLLQKAGYQTAIIGKWHLQTDPTGFDYWSILPGQGIYIDPVFLEMGKRQKVTGYVTDIITDKCMNWLDHRDKTKPFLLMCHNKAPHRNWVPDEKHANMYEDHEIAKPVTFDDDYSGRGRAAHEQEMTVKYHLTKQDVKMDPPPGLSEEALKTWKYERFIRDYLKCIASVDDNVGRLLDYLDKNDLTKNTIVFYTSDNGFFLGDHGWFDKRFMYEESLRVPLIARLPGKVAPKSVSNQIVCNLDFGPTMLDYAGAPIPPDMQGKSLRPILEGKPTEWRKAFYYHYYEFPQPHHVQPHAGIRTDRYKLINYYDINEWELFDLEKDPHELKSVYDDPGYAKIRDDMKQQFDAAKKEYKDNDFGPVK